MDYIHCPNMGLLQKIKKYMLSRVTTPYTLMNADDIYPSPKAIEHALAFLESNADYSTVLGNSLNYSSEKLQFEYHSFNHHFKTDSSSPSTRLLQHFTNYIPIYYSVQRTDIVKTAFEKLPADLKNFNFTEFFFSMITLLYGKVKRVQDFDYITQDVPSVIHLASHMRGTTKAMTTDPQYYPEIDALRKTISDLITEVEGLPPEVSRRYAEATLDIYLSRILPSKKYYWLRHSPPKTRATRNRAFFKRLLTRFRGNSNDRRPTHNAEKTDNTDARLATATDNRIDDLEQIISILDS